MTAQAAQHPTLEQLAAFVHGRLDPTAQAEVESHVAECAECCRRLESVPNDTLVERLRAGNTQASLASVSAPPDEAAVTGIPAALAHHPRYRVVRMVGKGGMGVVYQAEHRIMERAVALKVIHPQLLRHPVAVERFRREVRAAARLTHRNIVTAYDAEQADDTHFLVMEYVEGVSLAQLVERRGPLSPLEACYCIRQAAAGLQHAFEQGMVHRDIKPQNLMLTRNSHVKILDFGLARFARDSELAADSTGGATLVSAAHTAASSLLGTPEYMAPEQMRSARDVDIRADIYSLGGTFYFLLTGRPPHALGGAVARPQAVPVDTLLADVPPVAADVLRRMIATDPADRFQTPAEVVQAMRELIHRLKPGLPDSASASLSVAGARDLPSPLPRRLAGGRRRTSYLLAAVLGTVAACALAAAFTWSLLSRGPLASTDRGGAPPPAVAAGDASGTGNAATPGGKSETRPALLVVLPAEYDPDDYGAFRRAVEGKFVLRIGSTSAEACRPVAWKPQGDTVPVDVDFSKGQIETDGYAGIVFLGGNIYQYKEAGASMARPIWDAMLAIAGKNKPVAALGSGIRVLAAVEQMNDKPLALFDEQANGMFPQHRVWKDEPVVVDRMLVTARDSRAADAFVAELVKASQPAGDKTPAGKPSGR